MQAGYLGKNILGSGYSLELHLHTSAGRYMCGEETGAAQRAGGQARQPAHQAALPADRAACGASRPIVNNVETLCNVPHIVSNGAEWFRGLSRTEDGGTKLYGVSGRVKRPGLWELPMGTTDARDPRGARRRHARRLPLPRAAARRRLDRLPRRGAPRRADGLRVGATRPAAAWAPAR